MEKDKSISDVISKINQMFSLQLDDNNYDSLLCKPLSSTDAGKNPKSNQAHIAISNPMMMDIFPKIIVEHYKPNISANNSKSFYYLEIPITLYKKNIQYITDAAKENTPLLKNLINTEFQDKPMLSKIGTIVLSRRNGGSCQIELSGECKTFIRKVADKKDILIIAKIKHKLQYDAFIIKKDDPNADFFPTTALFEFSQKNKTAVNIRNYHQFKNHSGKNIIYYGAPGTGKSYQLNNKLNNTNFRRVTFYPDYDYTDFVGGMKPKRINGHIDYPYVGGILADMVSEAINSPSEEVVLEIEEINRANAASVFGDTFQLLDRKADGASAYSIKNNDLGHYIDKKTNSILDFEKNGVWFPSNFSIMATMNPADQGVYPLDTAFTRRWQMAYFPIDWTSEDVPKAEVAGFSYPWNIFGQALNHILAINGIEEDEMLGQHFMTTTELKDIKLVASKLLGYLWNNVLRYKRQAIFNAETLSDLMYQFEHQNKGIKIFNEDTQKQLSQAIKDAQNRLNPNDQEHPDEDNYENN